MEHTFFPLYADREKQNKAYDSTEELLDDIRAILLWWTDSALLRKDDGERKTGADEVFGYFAKRCQRARDEGKTLPYLKLTAVAGLTHFEEFILWMTLLWELDGEFVSTLQENGMCLGKELTLEELYLLYGSQAEGSEEEEYRLTDPEYRVNVILFRELKEEPGERITEKRFRLKRHVVDVLLGQEHGISGLTEVVQKLTPDDRPLLHDEAALARGLEFLAENEKKGQKSVIYLTGESGTGKKFFLTKLGDGREFLHVNLGFLLKRNYVWEDLRAIISYGVLHHNYISIGEVPDSLEPGLLQLFLQRIVTYIPVVCVVSESQKDISGPSGICPLHLEMEKSGKEQRKRFWIYFSERYRCPEVRKAAGELAGRYRLKIGEIGTLTQKLSARIPEDCGEKFRKEMDNLLRQELTENACRKLKGLAVPMNTGFTMQNLELPGQQTRILQFVITAIRNRDTVMEEMGFGRKLPYGQGISILLYGPPGTGKTMTAQVIANETGLSLFRVDSSQIMDKYIGETEKKLGELFETARNTNAILFFDEADSLFAKRTEVSRSTDKYANNEVSYLLQSMEQYDGIMILATNHSNFFDEAFRRRITYAMNLPAPDEQTRSRIWRSAFPEEMEIAEEVDFDELAAEHEFTGSTIKYIAQQAMYTAAALGTPVTTECIHTALKLMKERDCQAYKDENMQTYFTRLL